MNGFVFMVMWSAISLAVSWLRGPQAFPMPSWFIPNLKPMMIQWQHFEAMWTVIIPAAATGTVEKRSLLITERDLKNRHVKDYSPQLSDTSTFHLSKKSHQMFHYYHLRTAVSRRTWYPGGVVVLLDIESGTDLHLIKAHLYGFKGA